MNQKKINNWIKKNRSMLLIAVITFPFFIQPLLAWNTISLKIDETSIGGINWANITFKDFFLSGTFINYYPVFLTLTIAAAIVSYLLLKKWDYKTAAVAGLIRWASIGIYFGDFFHWSSLDSITKTYFIRELPLMIIGYLAATFIYNKLQRKFK